MKKISCILFCLVILFGLTLCEKKDKPDPKNPVKLSIWHTYVEQMGGEVLYLLPAAKSTEVLYVNRSLFDKFSRETGADIKKLKSFEGIMEPRKNITKEVA